MNRHRIFLTNSNNLNIYYQYTPLNTNYIMNPRLKRKQMKNNNHLFSNYSEPNSNKKFTKFGNSYDKIISHKDFHKNVHLENNSHNPYRNIFKYDFLKQKNKFINYDKSSSVEKDLDMMKIQMSCDLITHKINQIKNKVQDLHESSIQDDKYLLNKTTKEKDIFENFYEDNSRKIFDLNKSNNNNEDFFDYKNKIPAFEKINDYSTMVNYTINANYNNGQNNNNHFRKIKINNTKIPNLNINQAKKYHSNKNALKYILLNSSNNKNSSIRLINKDPYNLYNNINNSNVLTKSNYLNKINHNHNFNLLNNKIIESYLTKKKYIYIKHQK